VDELKVRVDGLAEVNRALRAVDKDAPKQLRLGLNEVANLLIDRARPKIAQVTGAARRSLVAQSTRTSARITVGGKKAPYFAWWSFGGEGRVKGRPPKRPFVKEGRDIYPTLRQIRPEIEAMLNDRITAVVRGAGLDTD
jgi:hypothetical protein